MSDMSDVVDVSLRVGDQVVVDLAGFSAVLSRIRSRGYTLFGPTVRDEVIVIDEIEGVDDLPAGWTEHQTAGSYRLRKREDGALFGFASTPESWKRLLFPPRLRLFAARRTGKKVEVEAEKHSAGKMALIAARSCDLHAIGIHDRVFLGDGHRDPAYGARRAEVFVLAVNCGEAGGTCFCVSMGTGPRAREGFDLAVTELVDGEHRFVVEIGSESGRDTLAGSIAANAGEEDLRAAERVVERTAAAMPRRLETEGLRELLAANYEHPRWDTVAERCLSCANCTLVCPTCFCSTVEDVTDLTGDHAERWRVWDSCFNADFSYIHGGSVRSSTRSRYRQWLTHKLSTWFDQFGSSGCVGCGRCITWCPVGIDLTEEVRAIRGSTGEGGEEK